MDNMAQARNHLHEMEAKKKADSNKKTKKITTQAKRCHKKRHNERGGADGCSAGVPDKGQPNSNKEKSPAGGTGL